MSKKNGWKELFVNDLIEAGHAETKTGPFGTQLKASNYVDSGTPVINVRNIGFGTIRPDKLEFIGPDTVERLSTHLLLEEDIVFGRKGAVERHAFIRPEQRHWFQGSDCLRLRFNANNIVLPRFVSYFLLTEEHKSWMMNQCSHGATMASLNQEIISRIPLRLPSLPTQRKVASILSAYDDLIENNTRRIAILEEMAQAVYREWFVNFRFPGHENVKLVDSPLGQIPEGWKVVNLFEVADVAYGFPYKSKQFTDQPIGKPVIRIRDILGHKSRTYTVEDAGLKFVVTNGDFLIGMDGDFHMCLWAGGEAVLNQRVARLRTKGQLPQYALFHAVNGPIKHFNATIVGTTVAHLGDKHLREINVLLPSHEFRAEVHSEFAPLFLEEINLRKKNELLRTTRDMLLPKLISGQLDVEDLDIDVGEPLEELEEAKA